MKTLLNFFSGSKGLNIILSIGLTLSVLSGIKQCREKNEYKEKYSHSTKEINTTTQVLERVTDSAGRNHLKVKDNIIHSNGSKERLAVSPGIIDTVSIALKIAKEKINELTRVNAVLVASNLKGNAVQTSTREGTITTVYKYKDRYADLSFNSRDTTFDFKYNLDLKTAGYRDKSWLLGTPVDVLELYSEDPRVTINSVERYKIETPDPNFGLKLKSKVQYNFRNKDISVGPAIKLNMGRFIAEGSYLINTSNGNKNPIAEVSYEIFRTK